MARDGWRNRIMGHGVKPAAEFLAHPSNWRLHPQFQQDTLGVSLARVGWIDEVTENLTTGMVVDGHLRVTLALRLGDDTPVPVRYVELTPAEEAETLLTKDPIAALAMADPEPLEALIHDVSQSTDALDGLLHTLITQEHLFATIAARPAPSLKVPCRLGSVTFTVPRDLLERWRQVVMQRYPQRTLTQAAESWFLDTLLTQRRSPRARA